MQKKLLFVTTRLFWPTDSGRKVVLYNYCKRLHEEYGYDVHLYSFLENGQSPRLLDEKPSFLASVRIASRISKVEVVRNLLCHSRPSSLWPIQCCLFYSRKNSQRIKSLVSDLRPDVIIVDMIRTAQYFCSSESVNVRKILDMDDLLSKRYGRMLAVGDASSVLGKRGAFGSVTKLRIWKTLQSSLGRLVLRSEIKRLEVAEQTIARNYDSVLFISAVETAEFNRCDPERRAVTVTMGVDYEYFSEDIALVENLGRLSFLGNFNYAPNLDSLRFITDQVMPRMRNKARLTVLGVAAESLKNLYSQRDDVEIVGCVADVRPYIRGTSVFLSPTGWGTGIKTKILEAMAMGMPVVTNSIGAEGLAARRGHDLIVAESAEELAQAVDNLLESPVRRREIGRNAEQFVRMNHRWSSVTEVFRQLDL